MRFDIYVDCSLPETVVLSYTAVRTTEQAQTKVCSLVFHQLPLSQHHFPIWPRQVVKATTVISIEHSCSCFARRLMRHRACAKEKRTPRNPPRSSRAARRAQRQTTCVNALYFLRRKRGDRRALVVGGALEAR
jgi:hypothetical protein